jgi:hypothetical protein
MRAGLLGIALIGAVGIVAGCGDENTDLGGGGSRSACEGKTWREATPGIVVCPGAPDCACSDGSVCCVDVVNGKASNGSCKALADCAGPALVCDGTEDCPSGKICCLVDTAGGGGSCRDPKDCFFTNENTLCRDDAECDGIHHCTPSPPGAYLEGLVAACML